MGMGVSILILVGWLVLGVVVTTASAVVYAKAGFDDWGNYAAFGPFAGMIFVGSLFSAGLLDGPMVSVSLVVVLLSFFTTLFLLAIRRWPGPELKEGGGV